MRVRRWSIFTCLALAGCDSGLLAPETDTATSPVIYGTDDRADWYAAPAGWQQIMGDSIVALIDPSQVDTSNPNDVQLFGNPLGQDQQLCAGQRFADQPAVAMCSGTLIDDDLVLTAGHCLDSSQLSSCTYRFVFNFQMTSATTLATITRDDVYSCRAVAVRQLNDTPSQSHDFAIIQLDRPATPRHQPATVRAAVAALPFRSGVNLIGFPEGIPAKFAPGASVETPRAATIDFFEANIDSFEGNSGSGVFDNAGHVVGIAVSGQNDWNVRGNCQVANVLPDNGSQGLEQVSYAADAIRALCAASWPSTRLCGASTCGDGRCDTGELTTCAADCAGPDAGVSGDGGVVADAGMRDGGVARDAGVADSGLRVDAGRPDSGQRDSGFADSGLAGSDAGVAIADAGDLDAGVTIADASTTGDATVRPPSLVTDHSSGCTCMGEPERASLGLSIVFFGALIAARARSRRVRCVR